jgi:CrcB protein
MNAYLIVFLGAGLGGALRHAMNVAVPKVLGGAFPYHTLLINIIGSLLIGLIAGYFGYRGEASQSLRLFLTTGILGGFTTFSAFSLEAALLYERGQVGLLVVYIAASVGISLAAVFAGLYLLRTVPLGGAAP